MGAKSFTSSIIIQPEQRFPSGLDATKRIDAILWDLREQTGIAFFWVGGWPNPRHGRIAWGAKTREACDKVSRTVIGRLNEHLRAYPDDFIYLPEGFITKDAERLRSLEIEYDRLITEAEKQAALIAKVRDAINDTNEKLRGYNGR